MISVSSEQEFYGVFLEKFGGTSEFLLIFFENVFTTFGVIDVKYRF